MSKLVEFVEAVAFESALMYCLLLKWDTVLSQAESAYGFTVSSRCFVEDWTMHRCCSVGIINLFCQYAILKFFIYYKEKNGKVS